VVDLDLQFGDLGLTLGCEPDRTIFDLATSGGTLDVDKLDAYIVTRPSGLRVLMAPMRPDQASGVAVDFLRELYPVLRTAFDYTVVDTPPGFTPEVIATIDSATSLCMVGMLDAPSLKNTRLGLETLGLMGVPSDRVKLVLNRAGTNVGISEADVMTVLGRAPDVLVPSSRDVVRAVNRGEPIVLATKRSDAAKAFRELAGLYGDKPVAAVNGKRRFGRS
jgi:pilus assembly protein CpaE